MLTSEQAEEVRKQIIEQIESTFPEEKKESAKEQVYEMSNEELENFVKKNSESSGCIFCSIASGGSKSYRIAENEKFLAVLEINPVSRGHILVIPKKHVSFGESPGMMEFAEELGGLIKEKLSPKDVEIASLDFQGHGVINLIPVYNSENIKSERYRASAKELEEISSVLKSAPVEKNEKKRKPKVVKKPRTKKLDSKKLWLPKRIP